MRDLHRFIQKGLREILIDEISPSWRSFKSNAWWISLAALAYSLVISLFAIFSTAAAAADFFPLLVAALITVIQVLSLFLVLMVAVIGWLVFAYLTELFQEHWIQKQRADGRTDSFVVPNLRFAVLAFFPALAVLLFLLVPVSVVYWGPSTIDWLDRPMMYLADLFENGL